MSKMADIAQQLDEQCVDYGFTSYAEALEQGFTYEVAEDGSATLTPPSNGLEMAHEAWLEEKACALEGLEDLRKRIPYDWTETIDVLDRAIKFIKEAHD